MLAKKELADGGKLETGVAASGRRGPQGAPSRQREIFKHKPEAVDTQQQ
jgi:hypothetical protein